VKLRIINDSALPGGVNMQRDAGLLAAQSPHDDPVLRLYRWRPPAVSIGRNQALDGFDGRALASQGVALVRRPTGGRAILHDQELTYAIVGASPSPLFGDTLHDTYRAINRALLTFLAALGITADVSPGESRAAQRSLVCFHSAGQYEIRVAGRKLVGSAQRRSRGLFLQHGSILTGPGHAELPRYLKPDAANRASRQQLLQATTDLGQLLGREITESDHVEFGRLLSLAAAESFRLERDVQPLGSGRATAG
jgi:lipoate-protein ligase A